MSGEPRPDAAAVSLDDDAADGEADSSPHLCMGAAGEFAENSLFLVGGDAGTMVGDFDHDSRFLRSNGDFNGCAGRGVPQDILHQIRQHLLH